MRLVILTQVLDRQDAVLGFFHRWCDLFARHVDELIVVAQQVGQVELPANVRVMSLGREHGASRGAMARRMLAVLLRLPRVATPTAVLAHMVPRFVLNAAPAAFLRRLPLHLWYTHKGVDLSLKLATPLVRRVFTASPESFRLATPPGKRVVTGHGIDCVQFQTATGPRPVDVLSVGRLAPSKGQIELLDALQLLQPVPTTELAGDILLESDKPYRQRLEERAAATGGRVRLLGAVPYPQVAELMRRARVLVNVSRTGSVDKVVLEAMAAGTLPLTCNESFRSVFDADLIEQLMFEPGNASELSTRLSSLLALDDGQRDALGARLRGLVQRDHDLDRLVPRIVAELERAR